MQLRTVVEEGAGRPVGGGEQSLRTSPVDGHSGPLAGGQQGGSEPARVDLVVAVDAQAAADARGEHGLQAAALAAGEPLGLQAAAALQGVQFAQCV